MGGMRQTISTLLQPLPIAGMVTLLTVGYALGLIEAPQRGHGFILLGGYGFLFLLLHVVPDHRRAWQHVVLLAMLLIALGLSTMAARLNVTQVLLVVWIACAFAMGSTRVAVVTGLLANAVFYLLLVRAGFRSPAPMVLINMGFQALAAICVYYARSAEQSRDALARVNADLLATRALLADSARDAERLRVARELHDVAGHKLTAMRLNLRALAADPVLAARTEVGVAERLSAELLADIRQVVQSLRDDRGLDLATALRALAAPFPRPSLHLTISAGVRVTDPAVAETVLRLAQEALTNAARHAGAERVWLRIDNGEPGLRIDIHDDGQCDATIREGNGIAGMRERLSALGGSLEVGRTPRGGLQLSVGLPA
jgi:signal transduction histidine kinase